MPCLPSIQAASTYSIAATNTPRFSIRRPFCPTRWTADAPTSSTSLLKHFRAAQPHPGSTKVPLTRADATGGAIMSSGPRSAPAPAAEAVVQQQLEAYNARDLEAFMSLMADHVTATDALTGAVLAANKEELRPRYVERFKTAVHSELLGRLCLGKVVVDREIISGLPGGAVADCLATYTVEEGKIVKMDFVWQPRPQNP